MRVCTTYHENLSFRFFFTLDEKILAPSSMVISKMLCIYYYFSLLFLLLYSGILFSHQSIWALTASIGSTTPVSKMLSAQSCFSPFCFPLLLSLNE